MRDRADESDDVLPSTRRARGASSPASGLHYLAIMALVGAACAAPAAQKRTVARTVAAQKAEPQRPSQAPVEPEKPPVPREKVGVEWRVGATSEGCAVGSQATRFERTTPVPPAKELLAPIVDLVQRANPPLTGSFEVVNAKAINGAETTTQAPANVTIAVQLEWGDALGAGVDPVAVKIAQSAVKALRDYSAGAGVATALFCADLAGLYPAGDPSVKQPIRVLVPAADLSAMAIAPRSESRQVFLTLEDAQSVAYAWQSFEVASPVEIAVNDAAFSGGDAGACAVSLRVSDEDQIDKTLQMPWPEDAILLRSKQFGLRIGKSDTRIGGKAAAVARKDL